MDYNYFIDFAELHVKSQEDGKILCDILMDNGFATTSYSYPYNKGIIKISKVRKVEKEMIDELKKYIDGKYGEYKENDIVSYVIQCKYNTKNELELYIFSGDADSMINFATINEEFEIYNYFADCKVDLLNACLLPEEITPEILLNVIVDVCIADNESHIDYILDVTSNLKEFHKGVIC